VVICLQDHPMKRKRRPAPSHCLELESLEGRIVLSKVGAAPGDAAIVARTMKAEATHTTLAVSAGTLGQPITFDVTVSAPAAAGPPAGTVDITDHGNVLGTLTLSPAVSSNPRVAVSKASGTLTASPGGPAYFFGRHTFGASFVPSGSFMQSSASKPFTVTQPHYTPLASGVKYATVTPGSGPQIQPGQTANIFYTGYLAKGGKIFDMSSNHGGMVLSFALGKGQLIPGMEAGTAGMRVGETRIIQIPPSQAYGPTANGVIPPNSTLVFEVTLHSIGG
jgi:hypothetical protein